MQKIRLIVVIVGLALFQVGCGKPMTGFWKGQIGTEAVELTLFPDGVGILNLARKLPPSIQGGAWDVVPYDIKWRQEGNKLIIIRQPKSYSNGLKEPEHQYNCTISNNGETIEGISSIMVEVPIHKQNLAP